MKFVYILLLTLPLICQAYPSKDEKPLDAVVVEDSVHAETEADAKISKRSGSLDLISHLKASLLSGIGQASGAIASGSTSASGGSSGGWKSTGHSIDFDPWTLKKSVLNTLLQAVKAITGGVTAIKGQLIKGSGYALSAGGKLVAASGDKVTDVGKAIISSAQLIPPHGGHKVHPFSKFTSLSGASSSGSSKGGSPTVHEETHITSYEVPSSHYGPPHKQPTYSTVSHQYLPPSQYGGQGFTSHGHSAYESSPSVDYVSTKYGVPHDAAGYDDFNIYGRSKDTKKPNPKETLKAALTLKEILRLIPESSKTIYTEKNVENGHGSNNNNNKYKYKNEQYSHNTDFKPYEIPELGPIETISHTKTVTASYGPPPKQSYNSEYDSYHPHPSDVYRQMSTKQNTETKNTIGTIDDEYKYSNYHSAHKSNTLNSLGPIVAALELTKNKNAYGSSSNSDSSNSHNGNNHNNNNYNSQQNHNSYNYNNNNNNKWEQSLPIAKKRDIKINAAIAAVAARPQSSHGPYTNYTPQSQTSNQLNKRTFRGVNPKKSDALKSIRLQIQDPGLFNRQMVL